MKKINWSLALCFSALLWSCNDNNTATSTEADTTRNSNMNTTDTMNTLNSSNTPVSPAGAVNTTPLSKEDSMFVMEAAVGSMMEVQAGNLAQQKGSSERVKNFGAMMVRDHSKASSELSSLVSGRGIVLPTELPASVKKHMDAMEKMSGKAFDNHYISMMATDHAKDIEKFKKQAASGGDAQLKNWASNTLPTLQVHKDSVDAIKKGKM